MKLILPKLLSLPQLIDIFSHICTYVASNIYRDGKEVPLAALNCLEVRSHCSSDWVGVGVPLIAIC